GDGRPGQVFGDRPEAFAVRLLAGGSLLHLGRRPDLSGVEQLAFLVRPGTVFGVDAAQGAVVQSLADGVIEAVAQLPVLRPHEDDVVRVIGRRARLAYRAQGGELFLFLDVPGEDGVVLHRRVERATDDARHGSGRPLVAEADHFQAGETFLVADVSVGRRVR